MTTQAYRHYRQASAASASPPEQVAILFDHVARLGKVAKDAIEKGEIEARFIATEKMISLLTGITTVIKQDAHDSEVYTFIQDFQNFCCSLISHLAIVNMRNDAHLCEQIITMAQDAAQIWRTAQANEAQMQHPPMNQTTPVSMEIA